METLAETKNETPLHEQDDEDILMSHVICDDHELLYLHTCLSEILEA